MKSILEGGRSNAMKRDALGAFTVTNKTENSIMNKKCS